MGSKGNIVLSFYDDQVSYCPFWRVTFLKCGKNAKNIEKNAKIAFFSSKN